MRSLLICLILFLATPARAVEFLAPDTSPGSGAEPRALNPDADPHPIVAASTAWPGVAIIVILGLFLAAGIIGPIVRAEAPEEVPDAFSHSEDPSHHAGSEHSLWEERPHS